ncbi:histidine phosphatase family protein [Undibacterium sp. TS12]|uniref:histidine phosphatase family protein n=1 Tax=Undibacterium sp. TS12 TaxID=2908202 RepID=UPI001F4CAE3C|nr:histidine phosphatase family protein [Undibacterium sp. TS12]MCH8620423.1 histidine phosphatase family protein [Undibacterium sp. TS12]
MNATRLLRHRVTLLLISLIATLWHSDTSAEPELIILVRHAEKAPDSDKPGDPGLSAAGQARAQALAAALQHSGVTQIFTTQYRRTRETAQAVATANGLAVQAIEARRGESAAHVAEVTAAVRAGSGTVLVVGHSNTVPAIATALGAPTVKEFCENSFGHMLVLLPATKPAQPARLIQSRYGAADAPLDMTADSAATLRNCQ